MRIVIAEHAGFCYGVRAAVEKAFSTAANGPCWTLGSLIHNRQVLDRLEKAGVRVIDTCPDCTKCQPDRFWSHRVTGGNRGSQAAIIRLKGDAAE